MKNLKFLLIIKSCPIKKHTEYGVNIIDLLEEKQDLRLIEEKVIYQNGNFTFNKLWV